MKTPKWFVAIAVLALLGTQYFMDNYFDYGPPVTPQIPGHIYQETVEIDTLVRGIIIRIKMLEAPPNRSAHFYSSEQPVFVSINDVPSWK